MRPSSAKGGVNNVDTFLFYADLKNTELARDFDPQRLNTLPWLEHAVDGMICYVCQRNIAAAPSSSLPVGLRGGRAHCANEGKLPCKMAHGASGTVLNC